MPAERLAKLKQLQKKKAEGAKQNRQELFKEHKKDGGASTKKQANELKELEKSEIEEKGESYERLKGWDYTMEDHEKWDEKMALKEGNKGNAGFSNYTQLAEQSYKKEISELEVDKDKYAEVKKSTAEDADTDFKHKPSKESVNRLLGTLRGADARRAKRRKNEDTDNYINTKNKQFNEKLDRHYGKSK